jgi:hypothetical protein
VASHRRLDSLNTIARPRGQTGPRRHHFIHNGGPQALVGCLERRRSRNLLILLARQFEQKKELSAKVRRCLPRRTSRGRISAADADFLVGNADFI